MKKQRAYLHKVEVGFQLGINTFLKWPVGLGCDLNDQYHMEMKCFKRHYFLWQTVIQFSLV